MGSTPLTFHKTKGKFASGALPTDQPQRLDRLRKVSLPDGFNLGALWAARTAGPALSATDVREDDVQGLNWRELMWLDSSETVCHAAGVALLRVTKKAVRLAPSIRSRSHLSRRFPPESGKLMLHRAMMDIDTVLEIWAGAVLIMS